MSWRDSIISLFLLKSAIKHIRSVRKQLEKSSYSEILISKSSERMKNYSVNSIVKSYFWASRFVGKDLCLPRSVALYQALKAAGYDVQHKFGVNKNHDKLVAHAWVEYNGIPLNEPEKLYERFKVLK